MDRAIRVRALGSIIDACEVFRSGRHLLRPLRRGGNLITVETDAYEDRWPLTNVPVFVYTGIFSKAGRDEFLWQVYCDIGEWGLHRRLPGLQVHMLV